MSCGDRFGSTAGVFSGRRPARSCETPGRLASKAYLLLAVSLPYPNRFPPAYEAGPSSGSGRSRSRLGPRIDT